MAFDLVIRNANVATASERWRGDLGIREGRIVATGVDLAAGTREVDAGGRLVTPGGVDAHCHLDQPMTDGSRMADDFLTGTRSAACGGTTTVIPFACQLKGQSLADAVADYHRRAHGKAAVDYAFHLIVSDPTPALLRQELPRLVNEGCTSVKLYMTYDDLKLNDRQILDLLAVARREGVFTMIHAENADCIAWLADALVGAGLTAPRYHAHARPMLVEREATHRAIALAELADVPVLIVHVSGREAVAQIREAQGLGLKIYAETCPQYLFLTEDDLGAPDDRSFQGARCICSPPPRDKSNQQVIWNALENGTFQVLSSDHAPFSMGPEGKAVAGTDAPFTKVPNGIPGLETRLPLLMTHGVLAGRIDIHTFVALTSTNPARLYGLFPRKGTIAVGADADLVVWDTDLDRTVCNGDLHHAVDYTPYEGHAIKAWPRLTLCRGREVWREGRYLGEAGFGRFLPCERPAPAAVRGRGHQAATDGVTDAMTGTPTDAPWRWSARTTAAAVAARRVSAREVAQSVLARLHAVNPRLNAVIGADDAWTLAQADDVDARLARGETLPLAGVPVTVKDNLWVQGRRVTQGSKLFADFVAPADAWAVARLKALGAVIVGITNCSEFACKGVTNNLAHGITRSPWHTALTPGGSSGGAVAALASGIGALALATDAGGSTRRPAGHCGLVGMKPTFGLIPCGPGFDEPNFGLSVIGQLARDVADAALMFELLQAYDGSDWGSQPAPPQRVALEPPPRTLRIAWSVDFGCGFAVDEPVRAALQRVVDGLRAEGWRIDDAAPAWPAGTREYPLIKLQHAGLAALHGAALDADAESGVPRIDPDLAAQIRTGRTVSGVEIAEVLLLREQLHGAFSRFFTRSSVDSGFDLLLTPTTPVTSWPVEQLGPAVIGGRPAGPRGHAAFTPLVNYAQAPACSVPAGLVGTPGSPTGLPVGLQVIGPRYADARVLQFAAVVERLVGPAPHPPLWESA